METVTLSVENVPRDLAHRLEERASRNHRSLQGELLAILTDAGDATTVTELAALVRRVGLKTPAESAMMVRDDREGRVR